MRAGNVLIWIGVALVLTGVAVRLGLFGWFGRLPGDIRVEGDRTSIYVPITSMILVSVVGSILLNILFRVFRGE